MAKSKLILVEGIPGSGKTSAARFVCDWLERHARTPRLFLEGDWDHPADFESVACLTDAEYADLLEQFPAYVGLLARQTRQEGGDWFFSYRRMQHEHNELPDALFEALAHYEIYSLPAERYQRLLLQNWRNFVTDAASQESTYVFECCFLQNPITTLLAYHDLPAAVVCEHIQALADIVSPLAPKLIYLARQDVDATLDAVRRERPEAWADFVIWYLTEQAYGKARHLSGFDGVAAFYAMRQAFELELLPTLPFSSTVIVDDRDWSARYEAVAAFLDASGEVGPGCR